MAQRMRRSWCPCCSDISNPDSDRAGGRRSARDEILKESFPSGPNDNLPLAPDALIKTLESMGYTVLAKDE